LRAVAVYLVLLFHAGLVRWSGGFIGVDVFFVLSGYLVTNLLVRDLHASDRVGWARFYSRRVRRLLPAAAVNLVVVSIVFAAIAAPVELPAARDSVRAAALYVSNWYFIAQAANYFGADIASSPVAQYWSLSVEEQFYVVWPLLVYGLFRLGRRLGRSPMKVIRAAVAIGGLASVIAALHIATYDLNRAYYGTDTRAYQLMAGAVLALSPELVARVRGSRSARWLPLVSIGLLALLVLLATSLVDVGAITRGVVVTVVVVGLIVALEGAAGGVGRRLLSVAPLGDLGRISYGTYLWHWIVILVATRQFGMSPFATLAVTVPLATGLAALSYELLEHPIRTSPSLGRHRMLVVATGLAASLLIGLVVAPRLLSHAGAATATSASQSDVSGTPNHSNWQAAFTDVATVGQQACDPNHVDRCELVHGGGLRVLLAGDSHAAMLAPMIEKLAKHDRLDLWLDRMPVCPWTAGIRYAYIGPNCARDQAKLFGALVDRIDPAVVILAHRTVDDPLNPVRLTDERTGKILTGEAARTDALRASITAVVHELRRQGRKVVLIEPLPVSSLKDNPETCLSKAKFLEQCRYVSHVGPTPEEAIYRDLAAADPGVVSVDLDQAVCPYLPICDPVVNGLVVKRDDTHETLTFAATLLAPLARILAENGVLK
jgi:peptidoglycan/LPS O-acetylase OafA/YrhL